MESGDHLVVTKALDMMDDAITREREARDRLSEIAEERAMYKADSIAANGLVNDLRDELSDAEEELKQLRTKVTKLTAQLAVEKAKKGA